MWALKRTALWGKPVPSSRPGAQRAALSAVIAVLTLTVGSAPVGAADATGPSSSETPYLRGRAPDARTTSLLTVGDSVHHTSRADERYQLAGIPDGMGAYDNGDGTFTVVLNHEIPAGSGRVRDHGANGAFVSRWIVRKSDLRVLSGQDLIQGVMIATGGPAAFSRFCSGDLAKIGAWYDPAGGTGYNGRIYLNGEEVGAEGRAFGTVLSGIHAATAYELPSLGKFSWENAVANPAAGPDTVVVGLDDSTPGQVYVYVGTKQPTGNAIQRAGLIGGVLYGVKVTDVPLEDRATGIGAAEQPFTLASLGDVSAKTGAQLDIDSIEAGVTRFLRPEDGSWDPLHPNDFYFVTTDQFNTVKRPGVASTPNTPPAQEGATRLWRLRFVDHAHPDLGGTISELLDGTTGDDPMEMMDNITVDRSGHVMIQEDVGGQALTGRVWEYTIATGAYRQVAVHDRLRFGDDVGRLPRAPFTRDEESSGIVDVSQILGGRAYLLDVQAHHPQADPGLVEGGQLLLLRVSAH